MTTSTDRSSPGDKAGMDRRRLVACCLAAATAALVPAAASASTRIRADARQKCATCDFWGGRRSVSADGAFVEAAAGGECRNPRSPAYRKTTRPDQGAPVWVRWKRLG
ncbi:hypothetical protein [Stappia sp. P2PMeth1]|uniref:hypothetical protein n=1 Tax=Stappia sp. P2PMeth1 TaxID=2003586 RepID=UPI0016456300|nr:hypothetical protein [Stappia sp. P2PMeth1]